jgi:hypothetical protein
MKRSLLIVTGAVLAVSFAAPQSRAGSYTDEHQCAYTYVGAEGKKEWVYGTSTVFRPEARPHGRAKCASKSPNCEFYGCFRR